MVDERTAPFDHFGVTLAIAPDPDRRPPIIKRNADWHHTHHPRTEPYLNTNEAGLVLRVIRMQMVLRDHHNEGPGAYHEFYTRVHLPRSHYEEARTITLIAAGHIPAEATDLAGDRPRRITLTAQQTKILRTVNRSNPTGYEYFTYDLGNKQYARRVVSYLTHLVTRQGIEQLDEKLLAEFLDRRTPTERMRHIGEHLLCEQAHMAEDIVGRTFGEAQQDGRLHPDVTMPAADFLLSRIMQTPGDLDRSLGSLRREIGRVYA